MSKELQNMKLKTKLLLGLSFIPVLFISLLIVGWFQLSSLSNMNKNVQTDYELSTLAGEVHISVKNVAISLRNITILDNSEAIEKEITLIKNEDTRIDKNLGLLVANSRTRDEKRMASDLQTTYQNYEVYIEEALQSVQAGNNRDARNLIHQKGHAYQTEFFNVLSDITNHFEANFKHSLEENAQKFEVQIAVSSVASLLVILLIIGFLYRNIWKVVSRLQQMAKTMTNIANGKIVLTTHLEVKSNDEIDEVAQSFNKMTLSLHEQKIQEQNMTWIKSNIAEITTTLTGIHDMNQLSTTFLSKIVPLLGASQAVIYLKEMDELGDPIFKLYTTYATHEKEKLTQTFRLGEGLVGQAVLEQEPMILTGIPDGFLKIKSGLGEAAPHSLYVIPILFDGEVSAVIEIASLTSFSETQSIFVEEVINSLAIILDSVVSRNSLAKLLEETQVLMEEIQVQSEELQSQQEELRLTNEELEQQTQILRHSEEELQTQQKILEETNSELEEKAKMLEDKNKMLLWANEQVEQAKLEIEEKAKELALNSKYKSEFLANMSHELRTPLNSLLILSKLLADNHEGNLSIKQKEYASTIYHSGKDLLNLINDILDLAKIEAGKMDVHPGQIDLLKLVKVIEQRFTPVAQEKDLKFKITLEDGFTPVIYSDEKRILQVLENLLSNAFKFTHKGEITLQIGYDQHQDKFIFSISDTGIGIHKDKQELIFGAFQQADGTTSRKYGGTGLGLSICREISDLLDGVITVVSEEGKGSTFTFAVSNFEIRRSEVTYLNEVAAAIDTEEEPAHLDETLSSKLEKKKSEEIEPGSQIKRLLIVDGDIHYRNELMELIGDRDVIIKAVSTGHEAIEQLKVNQFDCLVLDLDLSDTSGLALLEEMEYSGLEKIKVYVYTAKDLSSREEMELTKYVHTIIIKDDLAPKRLKEELELYLNSELDIEKNEYELDMRQATEDFPDLKDKKILLVDDDVRNVYALLNILELYGMNVIFAENGAEALRLVEKHSDIDLVLMDIMMPEMDGYEAIQRLRVMPEFRRLPVIALTAKAMKEDRDKCMEVGASDYIVKPVAPEQLISLMRVWLYKGEGNQE
jgi:signal transduction histidine kinase/DNA-binding response OmpR family regulator/HAMP domain-containing protein